MPMPSHAITATNKAKDDKSDTYEGVRDKENTRSFFAVKKPIIPANNQKANHIVMFAGYSAKAVAIPANAAKTPVSIDATETLPLFWLLCTSTAPSSLRFCRLIKSRVANA